MPYFNYHATAKKLISKGKLLSYYFTPRYRGISPALVLEFDDLRHPVMPIRAPRFPEYLPLLPAEKQIPAKEPLPLRQVPAGGKKKGGFSEGD